MIHDRDYMRSSGYDSRRSLTVNLVILLIVLFVIQMCLEFYGGLPLDDWFALSLKGFREMHFWQLLTFQFMHAGPWPWHVVFNCVGLYFLGRSVEEALGKREFLKIYFASGFFGAAVQLLTTWILPHHPDVPVVGASAGIMGLLAAYTTLFPMREITFFVMFFPITLRVQYVFWLSLLFALYGTIIPHGNVADAAHLGGLLMGVAYIRWGLEAQRRLAIWSPFRARERKPELVRFAFPRPRRISVPAQETQSALPSEEFITREVDPILDKISAHGIQSLTERERKILEAARAKMSKR